MKAALLTLAVCLALPCSAARAEVPAPPRDAGKQYGIEFFAGTWCFADGAKTSYAIAPPDRLRVTRLDAERAAKYGATDELVIRPLGANRFELRLLAGNQAARVTFAIMDEAAFTIVEFRAYDYEKKGTITHPANTAARRCQRAKDPA